jgi:O-antigen/teichoic acid export membrane protein
MHSRAANPARAWITRGEGAMAAGTLASQGCVYVLNILATRSLGPARYGELAALLTLTVIVSIPALALQMWAARTTAQGGDARAILPTTLRLSLLSGAIAFLLVVSLAPWLHTESIPAAASAGLLVVPVVWASSAQGFLQGCGKLRALAAVLVIGGVGRLAGGAIGLSLGLGAWPVLWGIGLGTVVVAGIAWALAIGLAPSGRSRPAWSPVLRISLATGAMWVLSNLDVLLARVALESAQSGVYAAGALIARATQFAPQFVLLAAFSALADRRHGGLGLLSVAAAKVTVVGLTVVVTMALFGEDLVTMVLGQAYSRAGSTAAWFALLGLLLALNQLCLAYAVARHDEGAALAVWAGVFLVIVLVLSAGDSVEVLHRVILSNVLVLTVLVWRCRQVGRRSLLS